MATRTVTFEVDTEMLFDMLLKMNGETSDIGARVVGALLAENGIIDSIGMAIYGVYVVRPVEQVPA
ncbi:hypothetical protein [Sphingobium sp. YR768]|jgi:hypothetical protein|uniref:hypothetical protein n=1 Tax=Sphingobium sp. YR768 TaxID=1884365 RepID=UPI0008D03A00|nr:hypothetical protein [Sphingobium sp. YR768]SES07827.1 hypothetical protein SAMN05518866_1371 [Sphingobium sp. YR768]